MALVGLCWMWSDTSGEQVIGGVRLDLWVVESDAKPDSRIVDAVHCRSGHCRFIDRPRKLPMSPQIETSSNRKS